MRVVCAATASWLLSVLLVLGRCAKCGYRRRRGMFLAKGKRKPQGGGEKEQFTGWYERGKAARISSCCGNGVTCI
ncbi:hypothetical protein K456DRAFT_51972 [Colletotrichum gloeosporioides 23]|nr:hypothetical protein K456DRAFT_51972 [Colletotrichum gloeosporioides 23]